MTPPTIDLIGLVESDLGPGRKYGRWVTFCCPFHDDHRPSLAVTNGGERRPFWKCFDASCGKQGGPLDWLTEFRRLDRRQALAQLGYGRGLTEGQQIPGQAQPGLQPPARQAKTSAPAPSAAPAVYSRMDQPPGLAWQQRGWQLVERASQALWKQGAENILTWNETDLASGESLTRRMPALDWLLSRGLNEDTLRLWKIGYIPRPWRDAPETWGVEGGPLYFPPGILIPCWVGKRLWYLKIRQPQAQPKYIQVRGSRPALYMAQTLFAFEALIFCEGELDALRLFQEVWDIAGTVTLGSASNELDVGQWGCYLLGIPHRFVAYDADAAGQKGAGKLDWMHPTHLAVPQLQPHAKDLTDFARCGGDLRAWVRQALDALPQPAR